ncbi:MAG: hypothetical protein KGJ57_18320 [Sphingomonadales bacterium]|nr:hypothetical protein [Sphingomonadales bacterium]MDE2171355.1 hypothetical protein [Sphingomonadales bacterium]
MIPAALAMSMACRLYGTDLLDLVSKRRQHPLVMARALAIWAMRLDTPRSYPAIGRVLGDRHHTSILSLHRKAEKLCAADPAFRRDCARVLGRYLEMKGMDHASN